MTPAPVPDVAGRDLLPPTVDVATRERILRLVVAERARQDAKWGWPNAGLAGCDPHKKLSILVEEVGEVAEALLDRQSDDELRDELVQVAAVAVAWLEADH